LSQHLFNILHAIGDAVRHCRRNDCLVVAEDEFVFLERA
jgi:putative oxidoreductase